MSRLRSENVTLAYDANPVVVDLSLTIPDGAITSIIGPNGCGKSTLLRSLARLMRPAGGNVLLDGQLIHSLPTREVARRLGLLQQQPSTPSGITVEDLVRRGRYPHQAFLQAPSRKDAEAVERALELTELGELRRRPVDQLSGGQRQRAWMAMALAQETPLLLLDEPTTYLDIAHQIEIIELVQRLNRDEGRTIVMVLHDVNEAALASDHIVALRDGRVIREGTPREVIEPGLLRELYGVECDIYQREGHGSPFCVPRSTAAARRGHVTDAADGFEVEQLQTGYGRAIVSRELSFRIPAGAVTAIVGPNACGKSTFLRTCSRLLKPCEGCVRLAGKDICRGSHRAFAQRLALLAQGPTPPTGFVVEDLAAAGRIPYQSFFQQWREQDEQMVESAITRCGLGELRYRELETLSGGQRQRAWMAMCLAQDTPVLLLDEPTTFLDIAAQIELLDLALALNREQGRTIVMILHDLNLAARYADYMIAMQDGDVIAHGTPTEVLTPELLRGVFEIDAAVITDQRTGSPLIIPHRTAKRPVMPDLVPAPQPMERAAL